MDSDKTGTSVQEAFETAAKAGTAEIPMTDTKKPDTTIIDVLRTRGTPIDMIESYIVASALEDQSGPEGNTAQANAAFRTCLLEYIYEDLSQEISNLGISFMNKAVLKSITDGNNPDETDWFLEIPHSPNLVTAGISLTPDQDEPFIKDPGDTVLDGCVYVPVSTLFHEGETLDVLDSARAGIAGLLHTIATWVRRQVLENIIRVRDKHNLDLDDPTGSIEISLIPDLTTTNFRAIWGDPHKPPRLYAGLKQLFADATLGIVVYYVKNPAFGLKRDAKKGA